MPAPAVVLVLALAPSALDLLNVVQPGLLRFVGVASTLACGAAAAVLLLSWARVPRTTWLLAASCAAVVGLVLRISGSDIAPLLSLLAIVAIGVGGGFASPELSSAGV